MPRTIESIVENHRVAAARRAAGKPVWDRKIDIKAVLYEDQANTSNEHSAQVLIALVPYCVARCRPNGWIGTPPTRTKN